MPVLLRCILYCRALGGGKATRLRPRAVRSAFNPKGFIDKSEKMLYNI